MSSAPSTTPAPQFVPLSSVYTQPGPFPIPIKNSKNVTAALPLNYIGAINGVIAPLVVGNPYQGNFPLGFMWNTKSGYSNGSEEFIDGDNPSPDAVSCYCSPGPSIVWGEPNAFAGASCLIDASSAGQMCSCSNAFGAGSIGKCGKTIDSIVAQNTTGFIPSANSSTKTGSMLSNNDENTFPAGFCQSMVIGYFPSPQSDSNTVVSVPSVTITMNSSVSSEMPIIVGYSIYYGSGVTPPAAQSIVTITAPAGKVISSFSCSFQQGVFTVNKSTVQYVSLSSLISQNTTPSNATIPTTTWILGGGAVAAVVLLLIILSSVLQGDGTVAKKKKTQKKSSESNSNHKKDKKGS